MIEDGLYPRTRLTDSIAVNENHGGVLLSVFLFVLYNKFVFFVNSFVYYFSLADNISCCDAVLFEKLPQNP